MPSFHLLLIRHGYSLLFFYVLAVAVGLPLPADPLFVVVGALSSDRGYSFFGCLLTAVTAAALGDYLWYELGRIRGRSILAVLCKLSFEPDTCVRKTETAFRKRGPWTLLFAKFIPGMSLVSVPLAGVTKMPRTRFLLADATGCTLWAGSYLLLGRLFHQQVDFIISQLGFLGRRAGLTFTILLVAYAGYKYYQRRRFIRELRTNRISPQQLLELKNQRKPVTIIDLRHPNDVARDGMKIAGALILRPDDLKTLANKVPFGQEIVLYCT